MEQAYVFVSYAHANSDKVLPVIRAMRACGIRVWYDDGIVAGSEWPEFIAEKVVNCQKFILFVSNAYLNSQNCKRELNFAISRKKEILSIFLEDANLSPGMEMQLGSYQSIFRNRFPSDVAFHNSICREPFFLECKGGAAAQNTPPQQNTYTAPNAGQQYAPNPGQYSAQGQNPYAARGQGYVPPTSQQAAPNPGYRAPAASAAAYGRPRKNRFLAAFLAYLLGAFGAHHFYMGNTGAGIRCLLFFWTGIPIILGIFHAVQYLLISDAAFQSKCR